MCLFVQETWWTIMWNISWKLENILVKDKYKWSLRKNVHN